jgi:hypothetical protein
MSDRLKAINNQFNILLGGFAIAGADNVTYDVKPRLEEVTGLASEAPEHDGVLVDRTGTIDGFVFISDTALPAAKAAAKSFTPVNFEYVEAGVTEESGTLLISSISRTGKAGGHVKYSIAFTVTGPTV